MAFGATLPNIMGIDKATRIIPLIRNITSNSVNPVLRFIYSVIKSIFARLIVTQSP
jgi:hypothetical protein